MDADTAGRRHQEQDWTSDQLILLASRGVHGKGRGLEVVRLPRYFPEPEGFARASKMRDRLIAEGILVESEPGRLAHSSELVVATDAPRSERPRPAAAGLTARGARRLSAGSSEAPPEAEEDKTIVARNVRRITILEALAGSHARELAAQLGTPHSLIELATELDVPAGDLRYPMRRLVQSGLITEQHSGSGPRYVRSHLCEDEYTAVLASYDTRRTSAPAASESVVWDTFISHASEDEDFVRPLATRLREFGLRVWFDEFEIELGDSLSAAIDRGLASSHCGIIVFSPTFLSKGRWTDYELRGITGRHVRDGAPVIPLFHGLSVDRVAERSPSIADLLGLSTDLGIAEVASRIASSIRKRQAALRKCFRNR